MSEIEMSRPAQRAQADVTLVTRGITVTARVDVSAEERITVSPAGESLPEVEPGDPVELFWIGDEEERTLPGRIADVEPGDDPRWHLTPTGPAKRSQRRKAVRGRVELPVAMPWAGGTMTGHTVDLSEAGMRALVDPWGLPPQKGARLAVTLELEKDAVAVSGELIWMANRAPQWLLAVRFVDLPDRDADRLRARVFKALRDERAKSLS